MAVGILDERIPEADIAEPRFYLAQIYTVRKEFEKVSLGSWAIRDILICAFQAIYQLESYLMMRPSDKNAKELMGKVLVARGNVKLEEALAEKDEAKVSC